MYADRAAGELLHQHRLPADLSLLPRHEGDPRLLHVAHGHAAARVHAGRVLHLPGAAQAVRHRAVGQRSSASSSLAGIPFSRRYGPEVKEKRRSDLPMEMLLALGEADGPLHVWFRRPGELDARPDAEGTAFVTFFSPRQAIPEQARTEPLPLPHPGRQRLRAASSWSSSCSSRSSTGATSPSTSAGRRRRGSIAWRRASSCTT